MDTVNQRKKRAAKRFSLRSVSVRVLLAALFDSILLTTIILIVFQRTITSVEEELIFDHLKADIHYLEDSLTARYGGEWRGENGTLMLGDTIIGDGSTENADLETFEYVEKKTGTLCYSGLRVFDGENGRVRYMRVAGSTKDAYDNPIMGTFLDDEVADALESSGSYEGFSNVQGRLIFCYYTSLRDAEGEPVGFLATGRSQADIHSRAVRAARSILAVISIVIFGAGFAIVAVTRRWALAVKKIEQYLSRISDGELPEDPLVLNAKDDTSDIADCVNEMVSSLKEKERIGSELAVATDIQKNLLPRTFPPFPQHDEFSLYATMDPAREVGGDFYDFFELDGSHVALVIADVSGKGVPAALFMVTARTLIKDHVQLGMSPAETLTKVNNILCEGNDSGMFVTGWLGILNTETGELVYANAGHNLPLVSGGGSFEFLAARPGFVLAGLEGIQYTQKTVFLSPGDALFLYTDGVTEATSVSRELYGDARLKDFMNAHGSEEVRSVLSLLRQDIDAFVGEGEQFDDITMLLLRYEKYGSGESRVFPADAALLPEVTAFVEEALERADCPMKTQMQISVALEELFVNVASYAYPDGGGTVKVDFNVAGGKAYVTLTDTGLAFNPLLQKDPDVSLSAEERGVGGLGILMVKKFMDDVKYTYRNSSNSITIIKSLNS